MNKKKILNTLCLILQYLSPLLLLTVGLCMVIPDAGIWGTNNIKGEKTAYGILFIVIMAYNFLLGWAGAYITHQFTDEDYAKSIQKAVKFGLIDKSAEVATKKILISYQVKLALEAEKQQLELEEENKALERIKREKIREEPKKKVKEKDINELER